MDIQRIQDAIDYIEEHLDESIQLSDIAKQAGYSMYHFSRFFRYTVGETLIDYLRKRRLTEAAKQLINTNNRIIDIAMRYGFLSQQAFSTAFKKYYQLTPAKYRKKQLNLFLLEKKFLKLQDVNHLNMIKKQPRIIKKDAFKVVGFSYFGSNTNNEIPDLFKRYHQFKNQVKNRIREEEVLGICEHVDNYDPTESEFSYLVGQEISHVENVPINMNTIIIPKQTYAVFTHIGDISLLPKTYQYIHGTYFFRSEYEVTNQADFEVYDHRFHPKKEDSEIDIYIPIK